MTSTIRVEKLTQRFHGMSHPAVRDVSFAVEKSECVALIGSSGSGKTTLLKSINRLIEVEEGKIFIDNKDIRLSLIHKLRRRIGYVFQQVGLFPHLSVSENIAITPDLLCWPIEKMRRRVDELLDLVELEPKRYRDRNPSQLSGGQQQRVGLARALAVSPDVLLLDEPFGALDPVTRERLQESFCKIIRTLKPTVIFVTHDMVEALLVADRIGVMADGVLLQSDKPATLLNEPATAQVAALFEAPRRQSAILSDWLKQPNV